MCLCSILKAQKYRFEMPATDLCDRVRRFVRGIRPSAFSHAPSLTTAVVPTSVLALRCPSSWMLDARCGSLAVSVVLFNACKRAKCARVRILDRQRASTSISGIENLFAGYSAEPRKNLIDSNNDMRNKRNRFIY